jgi:hypothetical protein
MVSFSKIPGMITLCIVVLTGTLGSAAPQAVSESDDDSGLAGVAKPTDSLVNIAGADGASAVVAGSEYVQF